MNERKLWLALGRLAPLLVGAGLLLLATAWLYSETGLLHRPAPATVAGDPLDGRAAPDFRLLDQAGQQIALDQLKGKVVTISFLYTSCPDVCPITAAKLADAYDQMPADDRTRVALLVVTVDPERDSQARRADYVAAQDLPAALRFLGGSASELQQVWGGYHIGVTKIPLSDNPASYSVDHTTVTYLIDGSGRERSLLLDHDFTPEELAASMKTLLNTSSKQS